MPFYEIMPMGKYAARTEGQWAMVVVAVAVAAPLFAPGNPIVINLFFQPFRPFQPANVMPAIAEQKAMVLMYANFY